MCIRDSLNSIESIEEILGTLDKEYKTLSAKQRSLNLELAKLEKMQERFSESLDMESPFSGGEDLKDRLGDLEEATKSMDLYRTQVNQSILSLKEKLNDLELELTNFSSKEATSNE